jgi:geranylgeranyl pyrophosphate synthase
MLEYKEKALMELNSFKQSPYKQALVDSVEYFIRRSI